ncbi:helix-turn-helix transcriptional regulator [Nonomuraea sp. NPDC049714]|uniref:helix-turn-helix transcriptional regulator n=1 Tax=Nonomuraea sp. NPDC049714 TaxID=3364357 RepID=UPI0037A90761
MLGGGGRRRVKGLRREEVAVLANVGSTWYTWLEQGRDVQPSVEVLTAIADALRLSRGERRHLFLLGGHADVEKPSSSEKVSDQLQGLLDSLSPHPAVVMYPWFEPLAYNAPFRFMIDDVEALPAADRNCAYLHFTHPDWIAGHSDHEQECAAIVAELRAYYGESVTDPAWEPLLGRLRQKSPLFVRLWDQADVSTDPERVKCVRSLHVGKLSLHTITMLLQANPRTRVVAFQTYVSLCSRLSGICGAGESALGLRKYPRRTTAPGPPESAVRRSPPRPVLDPITDPERIASLIVRRRDRLGGVLHEFSHARLNCMDGIFGRHRVDQVSPAGWRSSRVWRSSGRMSSGSVPS